MTENKIKCVCGHEWIPRNPNPKECPKCHRYLKQPSISVVVVPEQPAYCSKCGQKLPSSQPFIEMKKSVESEVGEDYAEPEGIENPDESEEPEPEPEEKEEKLPSRKNWEPIETESLTERMLVMPLVNQLQTDIEGFFEIASNPHIYHFNIDDKSLEHLQESLTTLYRLTSEYQSVEHLFTEDSDGKQNYVECETEVMTVCRLFNSVSVDFTKKEGEYKKKYQKVQKSIKKVKEAYL